MSAKSKYIPQLAVLVCFVLAAFIASNQPLAQTISSDPSVYSDQWRPTGPPGGTFEGSLSIPAIPIASISVARWTDLHFRDAGKTLGAAL